MGTRLISLSGAAAFFADAERSLAGLDAEAAPAFFAALAGSIMGVRDPAS